MSSSLASDPWERPEEMLPTLSDEQIERLASHGKVRRTEKGEILHDYGAPSTHFYVVMSGEIEILRPLGRNNQPAGRVRHRRCPLGQHQTRGFSGW